MQVLKDKPIININKPVFITSARNEKKSWWGIYEAIGTEKKQYFLPETSGNHGSRALWDKFSDSKDYWKAVTSFLTSVTPTSSAAKVASSALE